jgi:hypothetical protein
MVNAKSLIKRSFMTSFSSTAITLQWDRNNLILKRGQSSLVITPENVQTLRTQESRESFGEFWRTTALQNREARSVFQAWERKDDKLLDKIYQEMNS